MATLFFSPQILSTILQELMRRDGSRLFNQSKKFKGNKYYIPPSCVQRYTAILPAIIHSGYFVSLNPSCNPFAVKYLLNGANSRNRTYNLSLTRRLLYQLSYISIKWCRWRDLNPQRFLSTDFKSVVYANSTTSAI